MDGQRTQENEGAMAQALLVFSVAAARRLLGKATAALPVVQKAYRQGRLIIAGGVTNAFVVEELTGEKLKRLYYTAGIVAGGELRVQPVEERIPPFCFEHGRKSCRPFREILADFTADDVFIKGANALDPQGVAGVLVADPAGGTIGAALGTIKARGAHLLVPVGLEKLIPSVPAAAALCGIGKWRRSMGLGVGLIPLVGAKVITEREALQILTGVQATPVAAGGVVGMEGASVLAVSGSEEQVEAAWRLAQTLKEEPPLQNRPGD